MNPIDSIMAECEAIEEMKKQRKDRAMRYQPDLKDRCAAHYGVTSESLDLPYEEWAKIRARYCEETGDYP